MEKIPRVLATFLESTLSPNAAGPFIYHHARSRSSIGGLLARSYLDAVITILPITKQSEVPNTKLPASPNEKPNAQGVATRIELVWKNVAEYWLGVNVSIDGLRKTMSTSCSSIQNSGGTSLLRLDRKVYQFLRHVTFSHPKGKCYKTEIIPGASKWFSVSSLNINR